MIIVTLKRWSLIVRKHDQKITDAWSLGEQKNDQYNCETMIIRSAHVIHSARECLLQIAEHWWFVYCLVEVKMAKFSLEAWSWLFVGEFFVLFVMYNSKNPIYGYLCNRTNQLLYILKAWSRFVAVDSYHLRSHWKIAMTGKMSMKPYSICNQP